MYISTDIMRIRLTEDRLRDIIREAIEEAWSGIEDVVDKDDLTRAALKNGFKYIAFHNTEDENLTFFNVRSSGIHFGSRKAADERGLTRDDESWTNEYFLKMDKPYVIEKDFDWEVRAENTTEEDWEDWRENYSADHYLERNGFQRAIYDDNGEIIAFYDIREMLAQKGYDCIVYKNEKEDKGNYSVAMFNPNNIKLACITHDDNGNEIPLEKRFDTSTDDVRY